jgi:hypothetical protein
MADEIIRELWRVKDQLAKEHQNNIDRLAAALRKRPSVTASKAGAKNTCRLRSPGKLTKTT